MREAVYYGQVELIPGLLCDGYILDDNTAVMSERGVAKLLDMKDSSLREMVARILNGASSFTNSISSVQGKTVKKRPKSSTNKAQSVQGKTVKKRLESSINKAQSVMIISAKNQSEPSTNKVSGTMFTSAKNQSEPSTNKVSGTMFTSAKNQSEPSINKVSGTAKNESNSFTGERFSLIKDSVDKCPFFLAKVTAKNSPHKGRNITVYTADVTETFIRFYAKEYAEDKLRKNQLHIGKRCVTLLVSLAKAALDAAIREACGLPPEIQKVVQRYFTDNIFAFECQMLYESLKVAYPGRDTYKYQFLMATVFKYCYEDILGRDIFKEIKKNKKSYPIHQYIKDDKIRRLCVTYLNIIAAEIRVRRCKISEARKIVQELLKDHLVS